MAPENFPLLQPYLTDPNWFLQGETVGGFFKFNNGPDGGDLSVWLDPNVEDPNAPGAAAAVKFENRSTWAAGPSWSNISDADAQLVARHQPPVIIGDLDRDGQVTISDWVKAGRIAAGLDLFDSAADIDGDGQITQYDVDQVGRLAAGLEILSPADPVYSQPSTDTPPEAIPYATNDPVRTIDDTIPILGTAGGNPYYDNPEFRKSLGLPPIDTPTPIPMRREVAIPDFPAPQAPGANLGLIALLALGAFALLS